MIPLNQHIGHQAEPVVKVGDKVLKGQLLGHAEGAVSAPIHASSSGTVIAIEERLIPHPSGLSALCVVLDTDGYDQWQSDIIVDRAIKQQLMVLKNDADVAAKIGNTTARYLGQVLTINQHLATGTAFQQGNELQQAAFACAGMTGEEGHLTWRHVKADILQRIKATWVAFTGVGKADHISP